MDNLDLKTIWSPQASRTKICDFFRKCLNKASKKGIAVPFFKFLVLKCPILRAFHKSSDKFPHFTPKPWDPSKPYVSNSKTLGAATPPSFGLIYHWFK